MGLVSGRRNTLSTPGILKIAEGGPSWIEASLARRADSWCLTNLGQKDAGLGRQKESTPLVPFRSQVWLAPRDCKSNTGSGVDNWDQLRGRYGVV